MEVIHEAGWPVWFVIVAGAMSIGVAARYAKSARHELFPILIALGVATLLLGAMGTALGLEQTLSRIREVDPEQRQLIFFLGLRESLHNFALALVIASFDAILVCVGVFRSRSAV